jgi:D-serine deaminase-like pyridoxal phosphate-dependent protein
MNAVPTGDSQVARNRLWARLNAAVAALDSPPRTPLMVVDLDAFDANAADLARRAGHKPIRLASKSVRVPALIQRALAAPGFRGVLAYNLAEALWLERAGLCDDVVVAYPTVDRAALSELVASPTTASHVTLMVDDVAQLDSAVSTWAPSAPPCVTSRTCSAWPATSPGARVSPWSA